MTDPTNSFGARDILETPLGTRHIYRLSALRDAGIGHVDRLPYCVKVLLESCLRHCDGQVVTEADVRALAGYEATCVKEMEIPFNPGRVVLQDFTGVPAVVDLAAMRSAMVRMTGNVAAAKKVNPLVPCDLVIDHSVQVDIFASAKALSVNSELEFARNRERYEFLKWGQHAFDNFRVVPPATGIVHQVNLEYLAKVVAEKDKPGCRQLFPDSLVGTDSHTTMINGLGVVGWGVGGIEAEAVMLGQPIYMLIPEVVGFRLTGRLAEGCTATDLVLTVTEQLREFGVVGKFVEFFGPGLDEMPVANRATIANMAPEYGATIGFFPVDEQTLRYLALTGRDEKLIATVERYAKIQGLWRNDARSVDYTDVLELDLAQVVPSLAGPKRPQDRVPLTGMRPQWHEALRNTYGKTVSSGAAGDAPERATATAVEDADVDGVQVELDGHKFRLRHGHVCIAAITSCTNTSNPSVMVAAGLVARRANQRGLTRKPWVKTSLAPGSKVVTEYFDRSGLSADLEALGFHTVGYGCTTCIGNSGPLPPPIQAAIHDGDLVCCSVLSGNRNFEGRVSPDLKANYLASPPLVVAYALAGTIDLDLTRDPLGEDRAGNAVYLRDLWPSQSEIDEVVAGSVTRDQFVTQYSAVFTGSAEWQAISARSGDLYDWDPESTYVQEPPFFVDLTPEPEPIASIVGARCLTKLGDSVTTDHISPAGSIAPNSPAGKYLLECGISARDFNSYGSRRGNDRVMTRGTFANIRIRNQLAPGTEGWWTTDFTDGEVKPVYDASVRYREARIPLIVLAGKDYGMGSSRDWAAKGTFLLGVRAVIAASFERIHRSNLVGMGVLPLCFEPGETADSHRLDGTESFCIEIDDGLQPQQRVKVKASHPTGRTVEFQTRCRIDTPVEVEYYRGGGILHTVLRKMAKSSPQ